MTKHTPSRIPAIFIAFVALLTYTGCKESTIINTNITPAGDSLMIEGDSVGITARTVYDRFNTSLTFSGIAVVQGVGVISADPEVGRTESSVFFQVVPQQSAGYLLPADALIDSFVLVMPYIGFTYGDTANAVSNTYTAYYVTEDMVKGTPYYNTDNRTYDGTPLGSATVSYDTFTDSMSVEGGKAMPHLRIKLTDTTAILNKLKNANYASYVDFQNSFKGLYVKATNNGNNNHIPYFRLSDDGGGTNWSKAGIVVYYHDADSVGVVRSDVFGFNADNCAHFNRVEQDIAGSNAASVSQNEDFLFFQSRPGLAVEITTKDVKLLENRIVNKAEIVITEAASDDADKYFAPQYLYPYLVGKDANGVDTLMPIADATFTSSGGTEVSGLNFISGASRKVTIAGKEYNQYTINVPKEFQKALMEKREMTLHITGVSSGYIGAYRLKARKNDPDPALKVRMNVVYSKL